MTNGDVMPGECRATPLEQTRALALNDVAVERFADAAVIFVVPEERFLTVNLAAADVLETLLQEYGERPFRPEQLAATLAAHYVLSQPEAADAARRLGAEWLACGVLLEV